MAQFHVGQRARLIRSKFGEHTGKEVTIIGPLQDAYGVDDQHWIGYPISIDGVGRRGNIGQCVAPPEWLSPLTDPAADRFIESIKRLGREPINDAPKVTVTK